MSCDLCNVIIFQKESALSGLETKKSIRAAVHPDEANKFPKQIQSDFSARKPPSLTMKLYSLKLLGHCH